MLVRVKVALTCGTDLKVWKRGYHARMIQPAVGFRPRTRRRYRREGQWSERRLPQGHARGAREFRAVRRVLLCRKGQQNLCEDLLFNNGAYAEYIRIPGRIVEKNHARDSGRTSPSAMPPWSSRSPASCAACTKLDVHAGDTTVVIGCGPIGLKFIRVLSARGIHVIALGKRKSQMAAAERLGAQATIDVAKTDDPIRRVLQLTERGLGADSVIEAVGAPATWEWAVQMVRKAAP